MDQNLGKVGRSEWNVDEAAVCTSSSSRFSALNACEWIVLLLLSPNGKNRAF